MRSMLIELQITLPEAAAAKGQAGPRASTSMAPQGPIQNPRQLAQPSGCAEAPGGGQGE